MANKKSAAGEKQYKYTRICVVCKGEFKTNHKTQLACSNSCRYKRDDERELLGLDSGRVGSISELAVCIDLLTKGYYVFRSMSPSGPIDLIAMKDGKTLKIEVKTTYRTFSGKIKKPKHSHDQHDVMAVFIPDEKTIEYTPRLEGLL